MTYFCQASLLRLDLVETIFFDQDTAVDHHFMPLEWSKAIINALISPNNPTLKAYLCTALQPQQQTLLILAKHACLDFHFSQSFRISTIYPPSCKLSRSLPFLKNFGISWISGAKVSGQSLLRVEKVYSTLCQTNNRSFLAILHLWRMVIGSLLA